MTLLRGIKMQSYIILSSLILVMCIEVAMVCAIFSGLFCYLRWRLKYRKLSSMLKNLLCLTPQQWYFLQWKQCIALYRYNRPPSQLLAIAAFAINRQWNHVHVISIISRNSAFELQNNIMYLL